MTSPSESSPLLFATVLLDPPGRRTARHLGKTEVSSLLRFFFNGEIIVWRNFPEILYPVARIGVYEFDFIPSSPLKKDADLEIALKANTFVSSRPCLTWKPNSASWRPPPKTHSRSAIGKRPSLRNGAPGSPTASRRFTVSIPCSDTSTTRSPGNRRSFSSDISWPKLPLSFTSGSTRNFLLSSISLAMMG